MLRISCILVGVVIGVLTAAATSDCQSGERAPSVRLLIPAYFYPADKGLKEWDRLLAAAADLPIRAIVNPASGPGEKVDPAYTTLLDRAWGHKGLTLLGYVSTRYAKRPVADVKADVARWRRLYPQIHGVFLDEQASGAEQAGYYVDIYAFARKKGKFAPVVTNPGTVCAEIYLSRPAADTACVFEGPTGFAQFQLPGWAKKYAAARFAVLAYQVRDAAQMRRHIESAVQKGIGNVYVTDATGANPWDRLPAYWDEEVATVRKLNGARSP